jgi:hypothetical protein
MAENTIKYKVYYNGKKLSLNKACKDAGIGVSSVIRRMQRKNETVQEAFDNRLERTKGITLNGVNYPSKAVMMESLNLYPSTIDKYKKAYGVDFFGAVDLILKSREEREFTYKDVVYPNYSTALMELGLDSNLVRNYQTRTGCSKEAAIELYLKKKEKRMAEKAQ